MSTKKLIFFAFLIVFVLAIGYRAKVTKPDLQITKKTLKKDIPKKLLKYGTCNNIDISVKNGTQNDGTVQTKVRLVIRKKNKKGAVIYNDTVKIAPVPAGSTIVAKFKKVPIPRQEGASKVYIKATADDDKKEDESKETNNSAIIYRKIKKDC